MMMFNKVYLNIVVSVLVGRRETRRERRQGSIHRQSKEERVAYFISYAKIERAERERERWR